MRRCVLTGVVDVARQAVEDEAQRRTSLRKLGVAGQLLGGSLASMLALTECRLGQSRVVAAALNNPIVDWLQPDREALEQAMTTAEKADVVDDPALEETSSTRKRRKSSKRKQVDLSSWQEFKDSDVLSAKTMMKSKE